MLLWAEPQLLVTDMARALEFYDRLGMTVAFVYGDPPFYAQVIRDGARLNLRLVSVVHRHPEESVLSASIVVEDADALFREYLAEGVPFAKELSTEPWGSRTFIVADPDGNLVLFAGSQS